jgi:phospholipid transport system substrate-binding protein
MKWFCSLVLLPFLAWFANPIRAAQPIDEIKVTTDHIISILRDVALTGDAHRSERHRLIRAELDARFDWFAVARGCLGRHWAERSAPEQEEFVGVFGEFLKQTYVDKFETYYVDLKKVDYPGQRIIENFASVKVALTTKEEIKHPVEYRLERFGRADDWRIYDVLIEGVSLAKNYRDQFDDIIAKSSYEKLLQDLKIKSASNPP